VDDSFANKHHAWEGTMNNRNRLWKAFVFVIVALLLNACGAGYSIKGKIIDDCTDDGEMAKRVTISLAPTQDGENFEVKLVDNEWQGTTAATKTDNMGNFSFKDIPDGKYALFLFQVTVSDDQGNYLIIEVKNGSKQVLGDIQLVPGTEGNCRIEYTTP
jgi:hypothetical protein